MYMVLTYKVKKLSDPINWFGYSLGTARDFVLYSANYSFVLLWEEFLLMSTYGVISPIATVCIGVSICSQIFVLRCSIIRYFNLQFPAGVELNSMAEKEEKDEYHIEKVLQKTQQNFHAMLWPGMYVSTFLFALYIMDMTYDTSYGSSDGMKANVIVMFVFTLLVVPVARQIFYYFRDYFRDRMFTELDSQSGSHLEMNSNENDTKTSKFTSTSMEKEDTNIKSPDTENPIHTQFRDSNTKP